MSGHNQEALSGSIGPEINILSLIKEALQHNDTIEIMAKNIVAPIVARFDDKIAELKAEILTKDEELQKMKDDMRIMEKRLSDAKEMIEHTRKENNLLVDGIKEERNENVRLKISDLIQNKMGVDLGQHQICDVYRVGRPNSSNPRKLLIKFANSSVKNKVYQQRLGLRNNQDPSMKNVFINEDLTRAKQEIFYHARKLKKDKIIANTWTRDGQVYIKVDQQDGPMEVKYMANLKKYMNSLNTSEISLHSIIQLAPLQKNVMSPLTTAIKESMEASHKCTTRK